MAGRRSSEWRVGAGAAALWPGRRGRVVWVLPGARRAKLWREQHPEGDIQRKNCALAGWCLLSVVFLSPPPPPPCSSLLPSFSFKS